MEDFVKVRLVAAIVVGIFGAQAKEAGPLGRASAKLDWHLPAITGDQNKNVLRGSSPIQSDGSNLMKKQVHFVKRYLGYLECKQAEGFMNSDYSIAVAS